MFYKVYTKVCQNIKKENKIKSYVQVPEPQPNRSQRGKGIFPPEEQEFNKPTRFETSAKSFLILQNPPRARWQHTNAVNL